MIRSIEKGKGYYREIGWEERKDNWVKKRLGGLGKKLARNRRVLTCEEVKKARVILLNGGFDCGLQQPITFQSKPRIRIVDLFLPRHYIIVEIGAKPCRDKDRQLREEYPHFKFLHYQRADLWEEGFRDRLLADVRFAIKLDEPDNKPADWLEA